MDRKHEISGRKLGKTQHGHGGGVTEVTAPLNVLFRVQLSDRELVREDFWSEGANVYRPTGTGLKIETGMLAPSRLHELLPALASARSNTTTKHWHRHFEQRPSAQCHAGEDGCSFQSLRLDYVFSEDSGISSCGSSTSSSAADDNDGLLHSVLLSQNTKKVHSSTSGTYSGTVASVLAAGVSDSEETEHDEYDNEDGTLNCKTSIPSKKLLETSVLTEVFSSCPTLQTNHYFKKVAPVKDDSQFNYSGRDILDLGSNLLTKFPLRASELPDKNLPMFLQNRSQYHRLGKFGSETLCIASCKKQCGFSFPVPPNER